MELRDICKIILDFNKIGITYHVSPDGDALGSVLALLQALRKYGKEAYVISKDLVADNLSFLPYTEEITGEITSPTEDTGVVIVLDCGNEERISADLENYKGKVINIDHHLSNDNYGDFNYIDTEAAATAEIIYLLLQEMAVKVDDSIGKCLYTSLVTDTGSFRHSNATKRTHIITSKLVDLGFDHSAVHSNLFDNKSYAKVKLLGAVINDMELNLNDKVAVMMVTDELIKKCNAENDDSSDIVSTGLQIKGVEVSMVLKESEKGIKVSLRAKNDVDVRKIAEIFGGGGHTKASGILIKNLSILEARDKILFELEKELI
ncbi:phosphoesterase RecJ domain-containing protein [Clostridium cavendishii DSM 21758]|uniref:Phosphoesterase RecJ domain-containing protein n=1 Tax=Clostridium cavendishii DSM 21758 TaxID=1121302 RepID=A0A1M6RMQ9_9CLOT|nr:bifunctional oligoribonuclease/PAP phosphatase NrnA [Clostridium cavendishii]SHK33680.1 phosphoesterase RecJ domain-containing protein [Clostridium cavendishii DSM 21758]